MAFDEGALGQFDHYASVGNAEAQYHCQRHTVQCGSRTLDIKTRLDEEKYSMTQGNGIIWEQILGKEGHSHAPSFSTRIL